MQPSAEVCHVIDGYQEVLADVSRSLGLQGRTILEAGKLLDYSPEGMAVELKAEVSRRLSEILAKNQELQQELLSAQEQLRTQHAELDLAKAESRIDHLTQLPNRRAFEEKLAELQADYERRGVPYSLAVFDVDHFKTFNDSHGHAAGDAMLRTISKAAGGARRASDFLARTGGEEFAVLFSRSDLEQCRATVETYRQAIAATQLRIGGAKLAVTASFGVAAAAPRETASQLMARADEALYAAKEAGRNQVCLHPGDPIESRYDGGACLTA